jgi:hypothetical protein
VTVLEYPSIEQLHKVDVFFKQHPQNVVIQEKIDGSNFGIRLDEQGNLVMQSRTTVIDQQNPQMFRAAVEWAQRHFAEDTQAYKNFLDTNYRRSVTLYGEVAGTNKLKYNAPPFLLFDVRIEYILDNGGVLTNYVPIFLEAWADYFDVPALATLYRGSYQGIDHVQQLLDELQSGYGENVEGVVVKADDVTCWYTRSDGEIIKFVAPLLGGKLVKEAFRETRNVKVERLEVDPLTEIAAALVTEARVQKARQRAEEEGKNVMQPHTFIPYVMADVYKENVEEVKDALLAAYQRKLSQAIAKRVVEIA